MANGFVLVIGGQATAAASASGAIRDGLTVDGEGRTLPESTEVHIWIKGDTVWGNNQGTQYDYIADHGDDDGTGEEDDPILTMRELERRVSGGWWQGVHLIVHCMGGGDDHDNPTSGRIIWTRQVPISFGNAQPEPYRVTITYVGPRGMLPLSSPRTLVSASDVTNGSHRIGKTKLTFDGSMTAASYMIRWQRADGREVIAPFGVEENDVDGVSVYTSVLSADTFALEASGGWRKADDTFTAVQPAACFETDDGDTQFRAVHVTGRGASRVGNRSSAVAPTHDVNLWSHFERIAFAGRAVFDVDGELRVEHVNVHDGLVVTEKCSVRSLGSVVEGALYYRGGGVHRTASSQYDAREEASCRLLEYDENQSLSAQRNTQTSDPDSAIAGLDWVITGQGATVVVGGDVGSRPASLRILKGIGVNCKQGASTAIKVYSGSRLWLANLSRNCLTLLDSSGVGFWAVDGGAMRINDGPSDIGGGTIADAGSFAGPCVYTTTNHVKVGKTNAVALGTGSGALREVAGLNGVIVSTYDYSRAWVPSTEPTGYGESGT